MFFGTTPQIISQYLFKVFAEVNPGRIFIPFAGNFVVEQIARKACPKADIYSTDISLYSRAIGFGIMDREMEFQLKPEYAEKFPYIAGLKTPLEKAAGVIYFADVAKNLEKDHIPYYRSLNKNAIENQKEYVENIMAKLKTVKEAMKGVKYDGRDAKYLIEMVKHGDMVFYDPPVILGDYEDMFKPLEDIYNFTPEPYQEMTEEIKIAQLELMNKIGAIVYWRTNNPVKPPKGYGQVYQYQYKYHGNYCLYTNDVSKTWVGRFNPLLENPKNLPIIGQEDDITIKSRIQVIRTESKIGNHYRLMWVKKAEMTDSGTSFLFFLDDKLIGMAQLADSVKFGSDLILINSDPAAPTSKYRRLSKLILYLICTRQMIDTMNEIYMWEHTGFTTRVFTNYPVSMKYRSLFKLKEREEVVEGNYKYKLIYQNREKILSTYKAGLSAWLKKDGKYIYES